MGRLHVQGWSVTDLDTIMWTVDGNYSIYGNIGSVVRALQAIYKPQARHVFRSAKRLGVKIWSILNNSDHKDDGFNDRKC